MFVYVKYTLTLMNAVDLCMKRHVYKHTASHPTPPHHITTQPHNIAKVFVLLFENDFFIFEFIEKKENE